MELNSKILLLLLSLTAVLFIGAEVRAGEEAEYVRPPPRKAFRLPWDPKPSTQPQQVIISHFEYNYTLRLI